jgi:hypothetical protein
MRGKVSQVGTQETNNNGGLGQEGEDDGGYHHKRHTKRNSMHAHRKRWTKAHNQEIHTVGGAIKSPFTEEESCLTKVARESAAGRLGECAKEILCQELPN